MLDLVDIFITSLLSPIVVSTQDFLTGWWEDFRPSLEVVGSCAFGCMAPSSLQLCCLVLNFLVPVFFPDPAFCFGLL